MLIMTTGSLISSQFVKIGLIPVKEYSEDTTEFPSAVLKSDLEVVDEGVEKDLVEKQLKHAFDNIIKH